MKRRYLIHGTPASRLMPLDPAQALHLSSSNISNSPCHLSALGRARCEMRHARPASFGGVPAAAHMSFKLPCCCKLGKDQLGANMSLSGFLTLRTNSWYTQADCMFSRNGPRPLQPSRAGHCHWPGAIVNCEEALRSYQARMVSGAVSSTNTPLCGCVKDSDRHTALLDLCHIQRFGRATLLREDVFMGCPHATRNFGVHRHSIQNPRVE